MFKLLRHIYYILNKINFLELKYMLPPKTTKIFRILTIQVNMVCFLSQGVRIFISKKTITYNRFRYVIEFSYLKQFSSLNDFNYVNNISYVFELIYVTQLHCVVDFRYVNKLNDIKEIRCVDKVCYVSQLSYISQLRCVS